MEEKYIKLFGKLSKHEKLENISLIVIGGQAINLYSSIKRVSKDIDLALCTSIYEKLTNSQFDKRVKKDSQSN